MKATWLSALAALILFASVRPQNLDKSVLSRPVKGATPQPDVPGEYSTTYLHDVYYSGLRRATRAATSASCKRKIEIEYMRQFRVIAEESPYPFENVFFHSQCPIIWEETEAETVQPLLPVLTKQIPRPPPRGMYPLPPPKQADHKHLAIMYVMLVHDYADFAIRIINAVREPQHTFVVHIDGKSTPATVAALRNFSAHCEHVHVLGDEQRQRVNWGGFSMVNATLIAMHYAWDALYIGQGRHFDYLIDLSGTSYPIKSNEDIRRALASGKPGAVYMDVQTDASRPMPEMWQMYVECDDALHRIARMPLLRGMNMHIGSQWFALPKHVVDWYLHNPLPIEYIQYAKYITVADENYFSTLFKNSPYCQSHDSKNLLFVLFDKWENEKAANLSMTDKRKCLHPDPEHCGRSPTTLTTEYRRLLQVSRFMFARKFDPDSPESMRLVNEMDRWRGIRRGEYSRRIAQGDEGKNIMLRYQRPLPGKKGRKRLGLGLGKRQAVVCLEGMVCMDDQHGEFDDDEEGEGIDEVDLCLEMGQQGQQIYLRECDSNKPQQWLTVGPCTEGSNVTFSDNHCVERLDAAAQQEDMFCILQGWKSEQNLCLDISGEDANGGSPLISWDCSGQWNQLFRFLPDCSISAVQPEFIGKVRGMEGQNVSLCIEPGPRAEGLPLEGAYLKVEKCPVERLRHAFYALAEDAPEQLLYRWKKQRKAQAAKR